MRIDAYSAVNQVYQSSAGYKAKTAANVYSTDKVEISSVGKDYQTAKTAVAQAADVREDKIAEIKAMINAGTYNISGMDFANKIVDEYVAEISL